MVLYSCDSVYESQKYYEWVKTLKAGDPWIPNEMFINDGTIIIQSSGNNQTNYKLWNGVDGDVFVCVKDGVIVSTWRK